MNIPFAPPFIDDDVIEEVIDTLKSGWITTGPKVKKLEDELVKFTNAKKAICVNSWTSGAILVLKWFGVKEGDEVIVPAYTYSATALSVLSCGAKIIMVDVGEDFSICCNKIRQAITSKTKVIIPVDFGGWPCDYNKIYSIINEEEIKVQFKPNSLKQSILNRILILSDAAHSIGAKYQNKSPVSFSDITIFSFHAVKNITTAEGGAICLNLDSRFDIEKEFNLMKLYTLNGQSKSALEKSTSNGWKYDILFEGLKVNMSDLCASIGLAQIRKYNNTILVKRRNIAERYQNAFNKYKWAQIPLLKNQTAESSYHLYALRIKNINEDQRNKIIEKIFNKGVSVNVHFIPMPLLTLFKNLGYKIEDFPASFDNYSREISLPIYPQLINDQVDFIIDSVLKSYEEVING